MLRFLYAGSCYQTNGIIFFLECLNAVFQSHKQLEFEVVLIFNAGLINSVREYASGLNIGKLVTITNGVPNNLVPAIYQTADVLVLPEMGDVVANAGFPNKTAEYLVSGKAILSTKFSDLGDFLTHRYNAMLVEKGDAEKYQLSIVELLTSASLRSELSVNALKTAQLHFESKKGVLPIIDLINSTFESIR